MFDVRISIKPYNVRQIIGRLRDVSPPLQTVAREKKAAIATQFQNSSDPDGNRWAALKPSTLRSKRQNRDKILTRTGKMAASFNISVERNTIEVTTNSDYAVYHQFGTRKMVRRLILKWTDKELSRIAKLIRGFIRGRG